MLHAGRSAACVVFSCRAGGKVRIILAHEIEGGDGERPGASGRTFVQRHPPELKPMENATELPDPHHPLPPHP